eukprot:CAMPEP_0204164256 /NCGR_PEP_ID=MMETSP0361-20130328/37129_1 /ASSEMBLY_ACC=CAM_ASM_000343 /TAXON_ID=268821 /ORGANISM="Scrippsiella Hangoei, Strain SHTV-5" /LENGTH=196 /DNA_ID=CAMNT_0051121085 /DNA_START=47 /DNA_END=633 /DNA_ORIENTATION=+
MDPAVTPWDAVGTLGAEGNCAAQSASETGASDCCSALVVVVVVEVVVASFTHAADPASKIKPSGHPSANRPQFGAPAPLSSKTSPSTIQGPPQDTAQPQVAEQKRRNIVEGTKGSEASEGKLQVPPEPKALYCELIPGRFIKRLGDCRKSCRVNNRSDGPTSKRALPQALALQQPVAVHAITDRVPRNDKVQSRDE